MGKDKHNICYAIEKHSPILIKKLPFVITDPGSYALCKNLTYNGANSAIVIASANVILNGAGTNKGTPFTLKLTNPLATGISVVGSTNTPPFSVSNILIKNLPIFTTATLANNSNIGINIDSSDKVTLSNVFLKTVNVGVQLTNVDTVKILNSKFEDNVGPTPPEELIFANGINGLGGVTNLTVENSTFSNNQPVAYPAGPTGNGATFQWNGIVNKNIVFRNCQFNNFSSAIDTQQANNITIENCQLYQDNSLSGAYRSLLFGFPDVGFGEGLVTGLILRNVNVTQSPAVEAFPPDGILLVAGNNGLIENVNIQCSASPTGELDIAALHIGIGPNSGGDAQSLWDGLIVRNVVINGANTNAISINNGSTNIHIEDSVVSEALVQVLVQNVSNITLTNNDLQGPPTLGGNSVGVQFTGVTNSVVTGNNIRGNLGGAVVIDGTSSGNVVINNILIKNGPSPISDGDSTVITPNTIVL